MTKPNYLPRAAAAEYLTRRLGRKITVSSLEQRASKRDGPHFVLIMNHASYTEADLDAWVESMIQKPMRRKDKAAALSGVPMGFSGAAIGASFGVPNVMAVNCLLPPPGEAAQPPDPLAEDRAEWDEEQRW